MPMRKHNGFTLIELVIVMAIMGLVITFVGQIIIESTLGYFNARDITDQISRAHVALERMTRDIRAAQPGSFTTMTAASVSFTDIATGHAITYTQAGNLLQRQENGGVVETLSDDISAMTLSYLADDGQTTAATDATLYYVTIKLTLTENLFNGTSYTDTLITSVYPQNFM